MKIMHKILVSSFLGVFGFLGLFINGAMAQAALPASAVYSYSSVNISQGNKDASQMPARPGDTIRYQVEITSDTEDVNQFIADIDISDILASADLVDSGLGVLSGTTLTYPAYSQKAPCNKKFTFFVRVKQDCGGKDMMRSTANGNNALDVPLVCQKTEKAFVPQPNQKGTPNLNLTKVGPESATVFGFIIFLSILLVLQLSYRKEN